MSLIKFKKVSQSKRKKRLLDLLGLFFAMNCSYFIKSITVSPFHFSFSFIIPQVFFFIVLKILSIFPYSSSYYYNSYFLISFYSRHYPHFLNFYPSFLLICQVINFFLYSVLYYTFYP